MKRFLLATVMVCSASAPMALTLSAQDPRGGRPIPGPGAMGVGPGGAVSAPAEFLLSQTGELKLTDAQVTRLAAIARRSAERRRAFRAQMDSLRPERTRGERPDSATRERMRQRAEQMRPQMEKLRAQSQADRRDAIAVLTPDQQARAWERIAMSGRGASAGFRGSPGRMGMRRGRGGGPGGQGFRLHRMGPRNNDNVGAPGERRGPPRARPEAQDSL